MNTQALTNERQHLANLLEAAQRCVFFLDASVSDIQWPLVGETLELKQKDTQLFQVLSAFNERFAKLQDTLGAAMRHSAVLMGENTVPFLRVLSLFEKLQVIGSVESWQLCRSVRNLAARDYETNYTAIAEHFNELQTLQHTLVTAAERLLKLCAHSLEVKPASANFETEFRAVCLRLTGDNAPTV